MQPITLMRPATVTVAADRDRSNVQILLRDRFVKAGGATILQTLLQDAGLAGHWKFRVVKQITANSHTPRIRLVRPGERDYQVQLKIKPGDNSTAVMGKLMVDRGRNLPVPEVYRLLSAVVETAEAEGHIEDAAQHADLDQDDILMGLTAVQLANEKSWGDRTAFLREVGYELGHVDNTTPTAVLLGSLRDAGYLEEIGAAFRLTLAGKLVLSPVEDESEPVAPTPTVEAEPVSSAVPATTAAATTAPKPEAPAVSDPLSLLLAQQRDLQEILRVAGEIQANRATQAKLRQELDGLVAEERRLAGTLQAEALLNLASGIQQLQAGLPSR